MKNNKISRVCGGGVLKNNNIVSSQDNDVLDFTETLQNQKNIKNQDMKNSKNQKTSKYANFFAFSLIELSIVLIIIGLLIAGVVGGKSLIESAKIRALINETNGYRQAVNAFYVVKGRLPGDFDDDGCIGVAFGDCKKEGYTNSSFPAPYNVKTPNEYSAPFIDLYLEELIDFKPSETNPTGGAGIGYPYSNIYKKASYRFVSTMDVTNIAHTFYSISNRKRFLTFIIVSPDIFKVGDAQKIDEKFDDGSNSSGSIRANCDGDRAHYGTTSYKSATTSGKNCNSMSFFMF